MDPPITSSARVGRQRAREHFIELQRSRDALRDLVDGLQFPDEPAVVQGHAAAFDRALDGGEQLADVERLLDEGEGRQPMIGCSGEVPAAITMISASGACSLIWRITSMPACAPDRHPRERRRTNRYRVRIACQRRICARHVVAAGVGRILNHLPDGDVVVDDQRDEAC